MSLSLLIIAAIIGAIFSVFSQSVRDRIFYYTIAGRRREVRLSFKAVGPYINTVVSIISLVIAIQAYRDSKESGPQQQAVLEKTKAAVDSSTAALQAVLSILDDNLKITSQQLNIVRDQWIDEKRRQARRPRLEIESQLEYSVKYVYPSEGREASGYVRKKTKFISEKTINSRTQVIKLINLEPREGNAGKFKLIIKVINNGDAPAESIYLTVNPMQFGVYIDGNSFSAWGPAIDSNNEIIYGKGVTHTDYLPAYSDTKVDYTVPLEVIIDASVLDKDLTIEVGVYCNQTQLRTIPIRFKIAS